MATSVQEFCETIARTRGSREAAAKCTRQVTEYEDDGEDAGTDGRKEDDDEWEEDEQRPQSSFSGFSGVVPTQTTASACAPRGKRRSVRLLAKERE